VILGAKRWRQSLKPHLVLMYARVHQAGKTVHTHCGAISLPSPADLW
jgi:hypothetical protein